MMLSCLQYKVAWLSITNSTGLSTVGEVLEMNKPLQIQIRVDGSRIRCHANTSGWSSIHEFTLHSFSRRNKCRRHIISSCTDTANSGYSLTTFSRTFYINIFFPFRDMTLGVFWARCWCQSRPYYIFDLERSYIFLDTLFE